MSASTGTIHLYQLQFAQEDTKNQTTTTTKDSTCTSTNHNHLQMVVGSSLESFSSRTQFVHHLLQASTKYMPSPPSLSFFSTTTTTATASTTSDKSGQIRSHAKLKLPKKQSISTSASTATPTATTTTTTTATSLTSSYGPYPPNIIAIIPDLEFDKDENNHNDCDSEILLVATMDGSLYHYSLDSPSSDRRHRNNNNNDNSNNNGNVSNDKRGHRYSRYYNFYSSSWNCIEVQDLMLDPEDLEECCRGGVVHAQVY